MVWSRQKRIAPESGAYSAPGRGCRYGTRAFRIGAGNENVARVLKQLAGNRHYLIGGLPFGENYLRDAVAQRAMVIDLGKAEILERHMSHAHHCRIDVHRAVANLLEQRTQLLLIHELRISKRKFETVNTAYLGK